MADKATKMVAQYTVTSPAGTETVVTHERAWHRILSLQHPARAQFYGFVRVDVEEGELPVRSAATTFPSLKNARGSA